MSKFAETLVDAWYKKSLWLLVFLPLSLVYRVVVALRAYLYRQDFLTSKKMPVPVIVVGNITVGGSGKTPTVIAIANYLKQSDFKPGIASRGYGSEAPSYPFDVTVDKSAKHCGDEPLLIAKRTGLPVVIDANRAAACERLISEYGCDVIITDDGLQHYKLQRDIEIVVVDAERALGNKQLLPMGPLREPASRLNSCDYIICNGADNGVFRSLHPTITMQLKSSVFHQLCSGESLDISQWSYDRTVHAVAGIGNPERFFTTLRQLGFTPITHAFSDHHQFVPDDVNFGDDFPVIMTEKDAVKLQNQINDEKYWYLPVNAEFDQDFLSSLSDKLHNLN